MPGADETKELTTRNQLRGTVAKVSLGSIMAEIEIDVDGQDFVAAVTRHSIERLGLAEDDAVTVLIKATEVMLAKGSGSYDELTTRNQIKGKVNAVETGSVMAEGRIGVTGGELVAAGAKDSGRRAPPRGGG